MKASLLAKIVVMLCIVSLVLGVLTMDKEKPYKEYGSYSKNININVNKVAVMSLEGPIASSYESGFFSKEANASNLLKSLQAASEDNDIKGVIIRINSPGGTVAMSQNIYNQIGLDNVIDFNDIAFANSCGAEWNLKGDMSDLSKLFEVHKLKQNGINELNKIAENLKRIKRIANERLKVNDFK